MLHTEREGMLSDEGAFIPITEIATDLDRTTVRVYQLIAAREIPAVKIGGRIRVPRRAYEAWLEQQNELAMAGVVHRGEAA
jgi:excisionase family DNA binding protein